VVTRPDRAGVGARDDPLRRHGEAAVGGYVGCPRVTRRGSEGASGGAHHPLIWSADRRAFAGGVDSDEGLRRMGGDVEGAGLSKGEVVSKNAAPDRFDPACRAVGSDWRAYNQIPGGDGDVGSAAADLDAIGPRSAGKRLAGPDERVLKPNRPQAAEDRSREYGLRDSRKPVVRAR